MMDPYVYDKSGVLINKLEIHDSEVLSTAEAEYTSFRISELVENPVKGNFNYNHLMEMHYIIFQDLYEWAGKVRTINVEKPEPVLGGISIEYSDNKEINASIDKVIGKMHSVKWKQISNNDRAEQLSEVLAELWKIHPFREGNTRTIITFCCLYIKNIGIDIDMSLFEKNSRYMRNALVAATAVFKDLGDKRQLEHLYRIVKDALEW